MILVVFCLSCSVSSSSERLQKVESTEVSTARDKDAHALEPIHLASAHFYSHDASNERQRGELILDAFDVSLTTAPGTLRTRMDVVIRNPSKAQRQARIRVPIPSNAAVTEAVLYVGDKPMRGAFLQAGRAKTIYDSYKIQRRDPLLAVWNGPSWVDLQIFPIEGEQTRRFQLAWVEPHLGGGAMHRVPLLANKGKIVGSPSMVLVDGELVAADDGKIDIGKPSAKLVSSRQPGEAFGLLMATGERPIVPNLVFVAETSARMTLASRAKQRMDIDAVLKKLPATTRVTLLSADWVTKTIAEAKTPEEVRAALLELDDIVSAGVLDIGKIIASASELASETGAHSVVFFGEGHNAFGIDEVSVSSQLLRDKSLPLLFIPSSKGTAPAMRSMVAQSDGRTLAASSPRLKQLLRGRGKPPTVPGVEGWTALESIHSEPLWMGHFLGKRPAGSKMGERDDLDALWARSKAYSDGTNSFVRSGQAVLTPSTSILVLESNAEYTRWGIPVPAAIDETQNTPRRQVVTRDRTKDEQVTWERAHELAREQGILGVLRNAPNGAFAQTSSDFASGLDDIDIYGGLLGNEIGEVSGGWGYGVGSSGPGGGGTSWGTIGGGGTGWGTIGTGYYGTIGYGGGGGGKRGGKAKPPTLRIGTAVVAGDFNKDIIRRYIRRNQTRIQHCYHKELLAQPELAGTLTARFRIMATGVVGRSDANGVGHRRFAACVANVISSIQFPRPKGGSMVDVSYPFHFESGYVAPQVVSPLALALTTSDKATLVDRVSVLSKALGVDFRSASVLAWWILKEMVPGDPSPVPGALIAAQLLHDEGDNWNAMRVLSQVAPGASQDTLARVRAMGFESDADRMVELGH